MTNDRVDLGLALADLLVALPELGVASPAASPALQQAQPFDREVWTRKLAGLNEADWRTAFKVGQELAALLDDEGFAILKANWEKIGNVNARQQLLKAWDFATPYPLHLGDHPRLLLGLDLGMRDPSPEVQGWAITYLCDHALQDFSEDFQAYKAWREANRDKPVREVIARSARRTAAEAAGTVTRDAPNRARWLAEHKNVFRHVSEARQAALDAGLLHRLMRWAASAEAGAQPEEIELASHALQVICQLTLGEAELRSVVLPLLANEKPLAVRTAAISALAGSENAWATDLLLDMTRKSLQEDGVRIGAVITAAAGALASFDDPK